MRKKFSLYSVYTFIMIAKFIVRSGPKLVGLFCRDFFCKFGIVDYILIDHRTRSINSLADHGYQDIV